MNFKTSKIIFILASILITPSAFADSQIGTFLNQIANDYTGSGQIHAGGGETDYDLTLSVVSQDDGSFLFQSQTTTESGENEGNIFSKQYSLKIKGDALYYSDDFITNLPVDVIQSTESSLEFQYMVTDAYGRKVKTDVEYTYSDNTLSTRVMTYINGALSSEDDSQAGGF